MSSVVGGTVWADLQGSIAQGAAGAALTFTAYLDTPFKMAHFGTAQEDELHLAYQMSHEWKTETEVHPHMHIVPIADPVASQNVRFTGYWVWAPHGTIIPALSGWTAFTADFTVVPGAIGIPRVVRLATVTAPATVSESDLLLVYVKRATADEADTYEGSIGVLSVDTHMQVHKIGTPLEFPGAQP